MGPRENSKRTLSDQSVLDLSRSSYLKGCVDGQKLILKKKTYGVVFEKCREMSKQHEKSIREILK